MQISLEITYFNIQVLVTKDACFVKQQYEFHNLLASLQLSSWVTKLTPIRKLTQDNINAPEKNAFMPVSLCPAAGLELLISGVSLSRSLYCLSGVVGLRRHTCIIMGPVDLVVRLSVWVWSLLPLVPLPLPLLLDCPPLSLMLFDHSSQLVASWWHVAHVVEGERTLNRGGAAGSHVI